MPIPTGNYYSRRSDAFRLFGEARAAEAQRGGGGGGVNKVPASVRDEEELQEVEVEAARVGGSARGFPYAYAYAYAYEVMCCRVILPEVLSAMSVLAQSFFVCCCLSLGFAPPILAE
jgi:hypothetical protein